MRQFFRGLFLALLVIGIAPIASSAKAESTLEVVKKRGKILLGVKNDYPPFQYLDKSNNLVGFDVDLWKEFAKDAGLGLEFVVITSPTRIPLLTSGQIDAVAGSFGHTIPREKAVDFTMTYFLDGQRFLVKKGSGIKEISDLAAPKKTATVQGSDSSVAFKKLQPSGDLVLFQEYPSALLALKQGRVDAVTSDDVQLKEFAKENPELEVVGSRITTVYYCMATRKNDSEWRDWINHSIQATWRKGTFKQIYRKYFPEDPSYQIEMWAE